MDLNSELNKFKCWNECKDNAVRRLIREYHYDVLRKDGISLGMFVPTKYKKGITEYIESRNGNRYKYIMITVNPNEDVEHKLFCKKIRKALKKVWINNWMYCIEWRDGEKGMHAHIKIWLDENKNPYRCKGEFYNTFKHVVGNKQHINIRYSNTDGCFEKYIMGIKDGEKKKNYADDIGNRVKYKMEKYYVSDESILNDEQ